MCGITGIVAFNQESISFLEKIEEATDCLNKRGPDDKGIFVSERVALGHRRLSIIDTSHAAVQPMSDANGRYHIIFNGEFFNYRLHRDELKQSGVVFRTSSDTEVVLNLYIKEGPSCLEKINGFFALAIFDSTEKTLFIARDRLGIKPLVYYFDHDKLFFASEIKSLFAMGVPKAIDVDAMHLYFQLNYLPPDVSIISKIKKLKPGAYIFLQIGKKQIVEEVTYYSLQVNVSPGQTSLDYNEACKGFSKLLEESVQRRLVSDVPLGSFLSGGLDSSVIVALASKYVHKLNTFSIGFKDQPQFDETYYAELVSGKYKTNHHTFKLKTDDLFNNLFEMLDYLDEPFADSSALNMYILCKETRKHVTVALSGDGADELMGGYRKHRAEWILRKNGLTSLFLKIAAPLLPKLEGSRNSNISNKLRQLQRFANGASLRSNDRYWQWCSVSDKTETNALILNSSGSHYDLIRKQYTGSNLDDLNAVFTADMKLVLAGDMLVKVDMMSMANSLEVRNPFIDKDLVKYVQMLPAEYKINGEMQKRILSDCFGELLPEEIRSRSKMGFEVPLLQWFRNELKSIITDDLLGDKFIIEQGLFNIDIVRSMKKKLFSAHPGDVAGKIWALMVFQYWHRKYFSN